MKNILLAVFVLSTASCIPVVPVGRPGEVGSHPPVVERTNIVCKKTADGWSKTCSYSEGTCKSLSSDMERCCGLDARGEVLAESATCNSKN